ncbi:hypothetical protein LSAT2_019654 [Lamellibrachia satsuma]|nr:hypothetical protein LSAT2_019654 [Lamellibrachia satsuma]
MHGEDNVDYKAVIEALKELALEGRNSSMEPYILRNMFPRKADNYCAYKGKMAIPPCSEDVLQDIYLKLDAPVVVLLQTYLPPGASDYVSTPGISTC